MAGSPCPANLLAKPPAFSSPSFCLELEVNSQLCPQGQLDSWPLSSAPAYSSVKKLRAPWTLGLSQCLGWMHSPAAPLLSQEKWFHTIEAAFLPLIWEPWWKPTPSLQRLGMETQKWSQRKFRLQTWTAVSLVTGESSIDFSELALEKCSIGGYVNSAKVFPSWK